MAKKSKPKKRGPEALTDRLYRTVGKYLEAHGWKVLVVGGVGVQQLLSAPSKFHYEFVVSFTGAKLDSARERKDKIG